MISFLFSAAILLLGYCFYGRFIEHVFGPDMRQTPALRINDGVDCMPLSKAKSFLIQLLNIAGTGPIFGAVMGAVFGPVVFLWIVFGCVLGGAVHDYMSGMISERRNGTSLGQYSGELLGSPVRVFLNCILPFLLVLCGAVFVTSPAALLAFLTPEALSFNFWCVVILVYYFVATFLPVDRIIGRIYPLFGAVLVLMVVLIGGALLFTPGITIPEISLENHHPNLTVWPYMFITVACGAISGFHATQSPIIAKCIRSEKEGRFVFYGAMICEGFIALVWAAAGVTLYETNALQAAISSIGQSGVVYQMSTKLLGTVGGVLAVIGVVVCPITSGDTAFRSARLILAETFSLDQKSVRNRLLLTIPLLIVGATLSRVDFGVLWRYFGWCNQTLAAVTLWVATMYLCQNVRRIYSFVTAIPATFMTALSVTYILTAKEGLRLDIVLSETIGLGVALVCFAAFLWKLSKEK